MRTLRRICTFVLIVSSIWYTTAAGQPGDHAPGELLVAPHAHVNRDEATALYRQHGAVLVEVLPGIEVHRIKVAPHALEAVEEALRHNPNVQFVERNGVLSFDTVPDDSYFTSQWHLPKISAPAAWDLTQGSPTVTIAIVDSGVDPTHPDLAGKLVPGFNVFDINSDTSDVYGHGTMVAGVAGAASNNGFGVSSVAWQSAIMPVRITDASLVVNYSTVANGITWAADHGAKVINVSLTNVAASSAVTSAANYARNKGALVIAAAGNCGCEDGTAANSAIISVAATDSADNLASFSTRGAVVDVAAPGVSIYTTTRGGGYGAPSGTSVASPIVAGVAALMWSVNPTLTPNQVESILKTSSVDLGTSGYDTSFGHGRVDAYEAVVQAMATSTGTPDSTAPTTVITSPAQGSTVSGVLSVQVAAEDAVGVARVDLYVDGIASGSDSTAPFSFAWDTIRLANGVHTLRSVAVDAAGNVGQSAAVTVTVQNIPDTTAPTVTIASPADGSAVSKNVKVAVNASDDRGVVKMELYVDGALYALGNAASTTFSWNTQTAAAGWHTLTAKAYDASGNVGTTTVRVQVGGTSPGKKN